MKIKEIMITNVITVGPEEKISNVAQILFKNRFHALPVVEEKKVIGIVSENDFFVKDTGNLFLPSYIDFIEQSKQLDNLPENKKENVKKILDSRAKDIMAADCLCVNPEDDILRLISLYQETKYNTYPVVNENKELVGIITSADLMGLIA